LRVLAAVNSKIPTPNAALGKCVNKRPGSGSFPVIRRANHRPGRKYQGARRGGSTNAVMRIVYGQIVRGASARLVSQPLGRAALRHRQTLPTAAPIETAGTTAHTRLHPQCKTWSQSSSLTCVAA
jgi:hypothetical protein